MSHKITAKNLQYNTALPPFLARLRGEHASGSDRDGPDPILAARRRPVKPRSGSAEAEDAPLVLDEHGNAVDVTVGADGTVREKEVASTVDQQQEDGGVEDKPADVEVPAAAGETVASVGDQRRKRKIGKVVGADAEEAEDVGENGKGGEPGRPEMSSGTPTVQDTKKDSAAATAKAKTKKKAKKIKLSFGDDEG
jgi:hypothetical protein